MQIVIEIDDELYEEILSRKYSKTKLEKAVVDGTPLPKSHGDLIDKSELTTVTEIRPDGSERTYVLYSEIENADVIVKADKERY